MGACAHRQRNDDGDDADPIITLTPRAGTPNTVQLLLVTSTLATPQHQTITLTQAPLDGFLGQWVEAYEKITGSSFSTWLERTGASPAAE